MLVDTSVWIDHFRSPNPLLAQQLAADQVWTHPFVIGELACGNLAGRRGVLRDLGRLHEVPVADHDDVLQLVEETRLYGLGLSWIDMHLLASARLGQLALWAVDKRLASAARGLGLKAPFTLN